MNTGKQDGQEPGTQWVAVGIGTGLAIGAGLGVAIDNLALGMGVGIAIGSGLGIAGSGAAKKKAAEDVRSPHDDGGAAR